MYSRILYRIINTNTINLDKLRKISNFLKLESLLYYLEKRKYSIHSINLKKFLERYKLTQDTNFDIFSKEIEL